MAYADFENALSGAREIDLTTTGRNSGRESTRPLWFVQRDGTVYLLPIDGSGSQWYRNVVKTPAIQVAAAGSATDAVGTPVTDPGELEQIVERFREKYGADDVERFYPQRDAAIEVSPA
jgi:hypothetical protein